MYHLKTDVERLYIPIHEGGRGLMQLEMSFKTITIGFLNKYLSTTNGCMLQLALTNDAGNKAHSNLKQSNKFKQELTYKTRQMKQPLAQYRRKKSKEKP